MTLTVEMFENTLKAAREYERANMGVRFGGDFSDFAKVLAASKSFKELVGVASMMGMLGALSFSKEKAQQDDPMSAFQDSPLKNELAMALYVGYRLGKQSVEVESLESLAR